MLPGEPLPKGPLPCPDSPAEAIPVRLNPSRLLMAALAVALTAGAAPSPKVHVDRRICLSACDVTVTVTLPDRGITCAILVDEQLSLIPMHGDPQVIRKYHLSTPGDHYIMVGVFDAQGDRVWGKTVSVEVKDQ